MKALDANAQGAVGELVKIAGAAGFEFTAEDFAKAKAEKQKAPKNEFDKKTSGPANASKGSPTAYSKLCLCEYPSTSF